MTVSLRKSFRIFLAFLVTLGVGVALGNDVSAKRVHSHYRYHQRLHRRHRRLKFSRRHGRRHFYGYRLKKSHRRYHRVHYRKHYVKRNRRNNRKSKAVQEAKLGSEVTYGDKDIDSMDNVKQMEYQTVKKINVDRAAYNLKPLQDMESLRHLARCRAGQLVKLGYLTHKNQQGRNYYEEDAKQIKLRLGDYSGENIASAGIGPILMDDNPHVYNNDDGKQMANMDEDEMVYHDASSNWGHRYNILNSHYKYMGIGAARETGTNNYYLAENFSS